MVVAAVVAVAAVVLVAAVPNMILDQHFETGQAVSCMCTH